MDPGHFYAGRLYHSSNSAPLRYHREYERIWSTGKRQLRRRSRDLHASSVLESVGAGETRRVSAFIAEFTTPVDPGGGNPGRQYQSSAIVGDWTNLWAEFTVSGPWSGSFVMSNEGAAYWFNRFPQPASPFHEYDPNPTTIHTGDKMYVSTNNGTPGLQVTVDLFGDTPGTTAAGSCQYGTRVQTAFRGLSIGAATLITLVADHYGLGWIGTVCDGLVGIGLATDVLCGGPPPLMPDITAQDLIPGPNGEPPRATFDTILQVYKAFLWPLVCECVPGSPAPTPPPSITLTVPPNVPTTITLPVCDEGAVCDILARLLSQVGQ